VVDDGDLSGQGQDDYVDDKIDEENSKNGTHIKVRAVEYICFPCFECSVPLG